MAHQSIFANKTTIVLFISLTAISILVGAGLIAFALYDLFTVSAYYYEYTCLAFPAIGTIVVMCSLFTLKQRGAKLSAIPLAISLLSAIGAFWLMRNAPDRDQFLFWQFDDYEQAVSQVLTSRAVPDSHGRITLPQEFDHLSSTGEAIIQYSNYGTTVYFPNDVELDSYS